MDKVEALERLRAHEAEIRDMGITRLSLFGSTARGDAGAESDVDLAVALDYDRCATLLDFIGVQQRLAELLGRKVDLVSEPSRKLRFQAEIDRDRVHVF